MATGYGILKPDQFLTNFAIGFQPNEYAYDKVNAIMDVADYTGKFLYDDKDQFRVINALQQGYAKSARFDTTDAKSVFYDTQNKALHLIILKREIEKYMQLNKGRKLDQKKTAKLILILKNLAEQNMNDILTVTANYPTASVFAVDGTAGSYYWNDTTNSDPIEQIKALKRKTERTYRCKMTHFVMNKDTAYYLGNHPKVRTYLFGTNSSPLIITKDYTLPDTICGMTLVVSDATVITSNEGQTDVLGSAFGNNAIMLAQGKTEFDEEKGFIMPEYEKMIVTTEMINDPRGSKKVLATWDWGQQLVKNPSTSKCEKAAIMTTPINPSVL